MVQRGAQGWGGHVVASKGWGLWAGRVLSATGAETEIQTLSRYRPIPFGGSLHLRDNATVYDTEDEEKLLR